MSQKISVQARMDEFFYSELLKYLKLAEEKRRWNVFKDIPWAQANPDTSETLAHCVETFCAVEMYLPDFTSKLLQMIRRSRGRAWFHVNWGYEESKHSLALESWLLASGHRSEEQREQFEKELLEAVWELPFDHPRQMVCYTMIQELATFWNYRNLEKMAAHEKDLALVTALRVISVDERVHYNFYRNAVKEWMKWDEAGTVEDLKYVFDNFIMPGKSQIPRYDESARILAKTGIYGPREYIKLVKNPILEDLRLDKDFHKMEASQAAQEAAKAHQAALENSVEKIVLSNGHAVAKNGNGHHNLLNSNALTKVLQNTRPGPANAPFEPPRTPDGRKKAPLLLTIGIEPKERTPSSSVILGADAAEKLSGSRGMEKYDETDQALMAIGDEKSNNAEEMRDEREQITKERAATRRNRVKNTRLMDKYNADKGQD